MRPGKLCGSMRKSLKVRFLFLHVSVLIVIMLSACTQAEATLNQAQREMPFEVLMADPVPDDWSLAETHYEDDLLVMIYESDVHDGQVELVQDRNIQGLDLQILRDHMISRTPAVESEEREYQIMELDEYIGKMSLVVGEQSSVQYTFVNKEDLISSTSVDIPIYQIVGKDVESITVLAFAAVLKPANDAA